MWSSRYTALDVASATMQMRLHVAFIYQINYTYEDQCTLQLTTRSRVWETLLIEYACPLPPPVGSCSQHDDVSDIYSIGVLWVVNIKHIKGCWNPCVCVSLVREEISAFNLAHKRSCNAAYLAIWAAEGCERRCHCWGPAACRATKILVAFKSLEFVQGVFFNWYPP